MSVLRKGTVMTSEKRIVSKGRCRIEYPYFSGDDTEMINRFSEALSNLVQAYHEKDPGKNCSLTYTLAEEGGATVAEYFIRSGNRREGEVKRIRAVWKNGFIKEFEKTVDKYPRGVYNDIKEKE